MKVEHEPPSRAKEILKETPLSDCKSFDRDNRKPYRILFGSVSMQGQFLNRSVTLLSKHVSMDN